MGLGGLLRMFTTKDPSSFKIVDGETGNPVGFYTSEHQAVVSFRAMLAEFPDTAEDLVLVAVDKTGMPVGSWLAEEVDALG